MRLQKWKSHKTVEALRIDEIAARSDGTALLIGPGVQCSEIVGVSQDWLAKHEPHVGGYLVVYPDGYQSFSPADAFVGGYTRLPS